MVQDTVRQQAGLAGPLRGQDEGLVLLPGEYPLAVLGPALPHAVSLSPPRHAGGPPDRWAGSAPVVQRRQAGPVQAQLHKGRESLAGAQAEQDTPAHGTDPVGANRMRADREPPDQAEHDQDGQRHEVEMPHGHLLSPFARPSSSYT